MIRTIYTRGWNWSTRIGFCALLIDRVSVLLMITRRFASGHTRSALRWERSPNRNCTTTAGALNFQIVDVLRIELRPDGIGDIRVRDRNTIHQPRYLVATSNVELVVRYVRSRDVVSNQGEAVRAACAGSLRNLLAAHERDRSWRVWVYPSRCSPNFEMKRILRAAVRDDGGRDANSGLRSCV